MADDRWAKARKQGTTARQRLVNAAPDDPLSRIAYLAAALGDDAPETTAAVERARTVDPPFSWPQIAAAFREHGDRAGRNAQERHTYRTKKGTT
jgi:hypothetical protein